MFDNVLVFAFPEPGAMGGGVLIADIINLKRKKRREAEIDEEI